MVLTNKIFQIQLTMFMKITSSVIIECRHTKIPRYNLRPRSGGGARAGRGGGGRCDVPSRYAVEVGRGSDLQWLSVLRYRFIILSDALWMVFLHQCFF